MAPENCAQKNCAPRNCARAHLRAELLGGHDDDGAHLPLGRAAVLGLEVPQPLHERRDVRQALARARRVGEHAVVALDDRPEGVRLGARRPREAERRAVVGEALRRAGQRVERRRAVREEVVVHRALRRDRPLLVVALRRVLGRVRGLRPLELLGRGPRVELVVALVRLRVEPAPALLRRRVERRRRGGHHGRQG